MDKSMENNSFDEIIAMIDAARDRAWQAVNNELVSLYWNVGKWLSVKRAGAKWGDKIVDNAAAYLVGKRPDLSGFTRRTLYRAVEFYETYKADQIVTPLVTQITGSRGSGDWRTHFRRRGG